MTTIIKFKWCKKCEAYHPFKYPDELEHEALSDEYVPLAEYQRLQALIQRIDDIGWSLIDETGEAGWNTQTPELKQLLKDCQAALDPLPFTDPPEEEAS